MVKVYCLNRIGAGGSFLFNEFYGVTEEFS